MAHGWAGWQRKTRNVRNEIQYLLEDAPNLRNFASEILPRCYGKALESVQEDYPQNTFSGTWLKDYDLDTLLNDHFWMN